MRVSEILQLQRGSHFTETTAVGLVPRHKLRGTTFKDHGRGGIPATWVVIAPVAEAIANQPFGVVAGKIQYQHVSVATFEGYAGQSASGFRSEIEAERQLQQLEDIVDRYEEYCRGVMATGPGATHIQRLFAQVQQELGDFPGKIVDRGRVRAMLLHLGRTLYPGLLNDCFFDSAVAHCLKAVKSETPLIAQCHPDRCPNSRITERHLPAWEQALAAAKEHLNQRRLPVLQRTIIEQQIADFSRVIAPLKGANNGGKPDNGEQTPNSDGANV